MQGVNNSYGVIRMKKTAVLNTHQNYFELCSLLHSDVYMIKIITCITSQCSCYGSIKAKGGHQYVNIE